MKLVAVAAALNHRSRSTGPPGAQSTGWSPQFTPFPACKGWFSVDACSESLPSDFSGALNQIQALVTDLR